MTIEPVLRRLHASTSPEKQAAMERFAARLAEGMTFADAARLAR